MKAILTLFSLSKLCLTVSLKNDRKYLNPKKNYSGPWTILLKVQKTLSKKCKSLKLMWITCIFWLATDIDVKQERPEHGNILCSTSLIILSTFKLAYYSYCNIILVDCLGARELEKLKRALRSSRAVRFAAITSFIAVCRPMHNFAENLGGHNS